MLDIQQIESFYPDYLKPFKKNLLRECLQYKILEIIFDSNFANKLSLMGGTAIRIVHSNTRFSEDLDFDNLGLNKKDFASLSGLLKKKLNLEGYDAEIKVTFRRAYRCYIRIPGVLFENKISKHKEEKILIQIDTEPQKFNYTPDRVIINKLGVFLQINVVPVDVMLAQKIYAILNRKRPMGRDFYDTIFLLSKTKPNYDYLKSKIKIKSPFYLKKKLLEKCRTLHFRQLTVDLEQFIFVPSDSKKILLFPDYIKEYNF